MTAEFKGYRATTEISLKDGLPVIETERLVLRIAALNEVDKIVRYIQRNRAHLKPWEPARDERYFTESAWIGAPERDRGEALDNEAYRFRLLLPNGDGEYIGTVSLRDIAYGPMHNAIIGYSLDHGFQGHGYMREAVAAVLAYAFDELNMRRVEACFMPANERSKQLLTSLGFEIEGLLRSSLEVDGKWEDHCICSLINYDWKRV